MTALLAIVLACSTERADVKALLDPAAAQIHLDQATASTIAELVCLPAPSPWGNHLARQAAESTLYAVDAEVVAFKLEDDGDYHVVLRDPTTGQTMIAEFVDPACAEASPAIQQITQARAKFEALFRRPTPKVRRLRQPVRAHIEGVAFLDKIHGQLGVAKNGVEIHPVLSIQVIGG